MPPPPHPPRAHQGQGCRREPAGIVGERQTLCQTQNRRQRCSRGTTEPRPHCLLPWREVTWAMSPVHVATSGEGPVS